MKKNNGNGNEKNIYDKSIYRETKSELLEKSFRNHKYVKDEEAIKRSRCYPSDARHVAFRRATVRTC